MEGRAGGHSGVEGRAGGHWWPALDGLRGLAVAAVVAYHLDETLAPGGFLGVSLFFSISGFLIVGQLSVERETTGRVDLRRFWSRRLRRLGPAFLVTVVGTLVAVALREPDSLSRVLVDAVAGTAYVANWHDMFGVAYADRFSSGAEPLAHLWSLSIEEQVYLFVPLAVAWWGVRRAGLLGAVVVGAGLFVWWGVADAYFATPVRLAEVLAGAALGVRVFRVGAAPSWLLRATVPAAATAVLAVAIVADTDPLLFRMGLPFMTVVWLPLVAGAVSDGRTARVLANPLLRWVGARSYAIYLFHVPLIELTDWSALQVVTVTLLAAEVSHWLVESPVRRGALSVQTIINTSIVSAVVASMVVFGLQVEGTDVRPAVVGAYWTAPAAAAANAQVGVVREAPVVVPASAEGPVTVVPAPPTAPPPVLAVPVGTRVVSVGDSTISALQPSLEAYLSFFDAELVERAVPGCSPLFTVEEEWNLRFNPEPEGFFPAWHCRPSIERILADTGPADVVVMFDHGMAMVDHQAVGSSGWVSLADAEVAAAFAARYEQWVDEVVAAGATLVVVTAPAAIPGSEAAASRGDNEAARIEAHNVILRRIAGESSSVVLVDMQAALIAHPEKYRRPDGVHFDPEGAVAIVLDEIGPALAEAALR